MSITDATFFLKLRETLDTNIVLRCASVKALIKIFEETKKKISDNCFYQKKYFHRKLLE